MRDAAAPHADDYDDWSARRLIARGNWRELETYPRDRGETTAREWGWEFLRRDRNYQETYDEFASSFAHVPAVPRSQDRLTHYLCIPTADPVDEPYIEYYARAPQDHLIVAVADFIRARWSINELVDPQLDHRDLPGSFEFLRDSVSIIEPRRGGRGIAGLRLVEAMCRDTEIVVRIDLRGSIRKQIDSLLHKVQRYKTAPLNLANDVTETSRHTLYLDFPNEVDPDSEWGGTLDNGQYQFDPHEPTAPRSFPLNKESPLPGSLRMALRCADAMAEFAANPPKEFTAPPVQLEAQRVTTGRVSSKNKFLQETAAYLEKYYRDPKLSHDPIASVDRSRIYQWLQFAHDYVIGGVYIMLAGREFKK